MKYLIAIIIGALLSNIAQLYLEVSFNKWYEKHGRVAFQPITLELHTLSYISRPISTLIEDLKQKEEN